MERKPPYKKVELVEAHIGSEEEQQRLLHNVPSEEHVLQMPHVQDDVDIFVE